MAEKTLPTPPLIMGFGSLTPLPTSDPQVHLWGKVVNRLQVNEPLEATVGVARFNNPLVQLVRPLRQLERMLIVVVEDEDDEGVFAELPATLF